EKSKVVEEMTGLEKTLAPHTLDIFPAFTPGLRGKHNLHGLIKLVPGEWVHEKLSATLRSLPPYFTINVDPESLL
ncbi:MAG: hypothetical protein WCW14_01410, partial [Candidatus Paceibacterota bacterium]